MMLATSKSLRPPVLAGLRLFWRPARADVAPLGRDPAQAAPQVQAVVRVMMLAWREARA